MNMLNTSFSGRKKDNAKCQIKFILSKDKQKRFDAPLSYKLHSLQKVIQPSLT